MSLRVIPLGKAPTISSRLTILYSAIAFKLAIACEGSAIASSLALKSHRWTLVSLMRDLRSLLNLGFHERSSIANQLSGF